MSEVSVKFTSDDAALWTALQKVIGGSQKLGEEIAGAGKKGRAASDDMKRFAEQVTRITTTPIERYNAQLAKLKSLLDADKISQDKYNAAVVHFRAELDKSTSAVDRNAAAVARSRTAQQSFGTSTGNVAGLTDRAAGAVAGLAAGYLSLQTALSLANQYLDEHAQRAERALDLHTKLATAQEASFKNLTGLESEQKLASHKTALDIAKNTGADPVVTESAIAEVYGVVGDIRTAQDAVRVAAKESPLTEHEIAPNAVSRALIAQSSGVANPEEVAGYHLSLQSTSLVPKGSKLGEAVVPALSSVRQMYPDQEGKTLSTQTGALHSTLGMTGGDREGRSTTTAVIKVLSELDRFFDAHPELKKQAQTPAEQIRLIQNDETGNLRKQILGKEGIGEAQFKAPIASLLTKGSEAAALFEKNTAAIRFDPALHQQAVSETQLTDSQRMSVATKKSAAASAIRQLDEPATAQAEASREITTQGLQDNRAPFGSLKGFGQFLTDKMYSVVRRVSSDADASLLDEAQLRERQKEELRPALGLLPMTAFGQEPNVDALALPRDIKRQMKLKQQTQLPKLNDLMRQPITEERLIDAGIEDAATRQKVLDLEHRLNLVRDMRRSTMEPSRTPATAPRPTGTATPPATAPVAARAPNSAAGPATQIIPAAGTPEFNKFADDLFAPEPTRASPTSSAPAVRPAAPVIPAAALQGTVERTPPRTPPSHLQPGEPEDLFAPWTPAAIAPAVRDQPRPQALDVGVQSAAGTPAVSPETRQQASVWDQVGRDLLAAVGTLANVADRLDQGASGLAGAAKHVGDLASSRRQQTSLPNYSGRARREAAQAVG